MGFRKEPGTLVDKIISIKMGMEGIIQPMLAMALDIICHRIKEASTPCIKLIIPKMIFISMDIIIKASIEAVVVEGVAIPMLLVVVAIFTR